MKTMTIRHAFVNVALLGAGAYLLLSSYSMWRQNHKDRDNVKEIKEEKEETNKKIVMNMNGDEWNALQEKLRSLQERSEANEAVSGQELK